MYGYICNLHFWLKISSCVWCVVPDLWLIVVGHSDDFSYHFIYATRCSMPLKIQLLFQSTQVLIGGYSTLILDGWIANFRYIKKTCNVNQMQRFLYRWNCHPKLYPHNYNEHNNTFKVCLRLTKDWVKEKKKEDMNNRGILWSSTTASSSSTVVSSSSVIIHYTHIRT
jgi:hypothetical protein